MQMDLGTPSCHYRHFERNSRFPKCFTTCILHTTTQILTKRHIIFFSHAQPMISIQYAILEKVSFRSNHSL